jgi:hypothetical protein
MLGKLGEFFFHVENWVSFNLVEILSLLIGVKLVHFPWNEQCLQACSISPYTKWIGEIFDFVIEYLLILWSLQHMSDGWDKTGTSNPWRNRRAP